MDLLERALSSRASAGPAKTKIALVSLRVPDRAIDHGLGIDILELPYVFEPFYRSPSVVSVQIHRTGLSLATLGLTVARRIARALGGDLTVTSELEVGSVFTLQLPTAESLGTVEASATVGNLGTRDE